MTKRPEAPSPVVPSNACSTGSPSGRGMQDQTTAPASSTSGLNEQLPMRPSTRPLAIPGGDGFIASGTRLGLELGLVGNCSLDGKSTRLNYSHVEVSYAVF